MVVTAKEQKSTLCELLIAASYMPTKMFESTNLKFAEATEHSFEQEVHERSNQNTTVGRNDCRRS